MKASQLEQEITSLREELESLRKKQPKAKPHSKKATKANTKKLESEVKKILKDLFVQIKKDYDQLSPATALLLFTLGALLGALLAKNKGGR